MNKSTKARLLRLEQDAEDRRPIAPVIVAIERPDGSVSFDGKTYASEAEARAACPHEMLVAQVVDCRRREVPLDAA
ncbi:MAG TPA: hypothetical protein PKB11_05500 [Desulfovibrio sp.]|uniref:hypothetical protein n=1 Tax=Desulfovibrio sp. TaxID=885 RepID=UPI002BF35E68|nr:hypothetical protein [Desulfovibrio sp.]HMM38194.1 hypothetical protein [Desulfovibrio sp.]